MSLSRTLTPNTASKILATLFQTFLVIEVFLFITHDFSWLDHVDEILLLQNGSIIERGTFNELISMGRKFAELNNVQEQI